MEGTERSVWGGRVRVAVPGHETILRARMPGLLLADADWL